MIRPLLWLPLAALSLSPVAGKEKEALTERVAALHKLAGGEWCNMDDEFMPDQPIASWTFSYQPSWSDEVEPEEVTLFAVFCMAGAYNMSHAYYIYRKLDGLTPLAFAMPDVDPQYEGDSSIDGKLLSVPVVGMGTSLVLVNSDFDEETRTITSYSKWRGLGDASSAGTWVFREGEFVLVRYEVDASYDGEFNPETVLDYTGT